MNTRIKNAISHLARENPSEEVCGFIYCTDTDAAIHPCRNIAEDRTVAFEIDPQDYIAARSLGRLYGVYHSHPVGGAVFSPDDLDTANELALPFYVYAILTGEWAAYVPPSYTVPPTTVSWIWGLADCFSTVQHHYRQVLGIHLTDHDRDETFATTHPRAILDHIESDGFINLGPDVSLAREHDVLLFSSDHHYPHHLAICLGHSRILHHPRGHLSRIDDLDGKWLKALVGVLRYARTFPTP